MSYVVLARKWRPRYFEEVVGQEHVGRTLKNALEQDRVAHAYLFCGTRGVGKTTTARILAKALNCEQGPTPTPCYECSSCEEIHEGQSVDVFEIDGASNRGINEIRELREGVRYAPSRDRFKIYIIDEVHMLTTEAFNALLKTLEEPPEHAHFIFATTEPQKIPVTILSRCQRFDFKRISQNDIVAHLGRLCDEEGIDAERAALQLIARQANGGMRDALSLMDQIISFAGESFDEEQVAQILGVANRKHLFELSEALIAHDAEGALSVLDEVNRYGYDLQQFASELVTHLRDLVVTSVVENPDRVTNLTESELENAHRQVDAVPTDLLHRYFSVMADGAREMKRSPYPKLLFEMTLVRMAKLEPLVGLDLLVDRLASLEGVLEEDIDIEALAEPSQLARPAEAKKKIELEAPVAGEAVPTANDGGTPTEPKAPQADARREPSEASVAPADRREPGDSGGDGEQDEPDEKSLPDIGELLALEERDRWRAVVEHVRGDAAPVAATLEHARLLVFDDEEVVIEFDPKYMDFYEEGRRKAIAEAGLSELFGPEWTLTARLPADEDGQTNGDPTLAEEREIDFLERKKQLEEDTRSHPVVEQARELFKPDAERVAVELSEE
ncbi:MAG: DNA polymerase III subunit gamma/tau [Persicimonas sp.]